MGIKNKKNLEGFTLIEVLISLVLLLTLSQLTLCFFAALIKQAKQNQATFISQVEERNIIEENKSEQL